jgi:NDP-sugar pyrophosphorylase family protein
MSINKIIPLSELSKGFIPKEYLPENESPFFFRNKIKNNKNYRHLNADELEILVKNNNSSDNWNEIYVTDNFDSNLVKNCEFFGQIKIGNLSRSYLEFHDLKLPVGISDSTIFSSIIGDNVVIRNVRYLAHYIIGDNCVLFNINEMSTSDYAKFGNGMLKEGEKEDIRVWLEICNENAGRKILPFENLIPADAFIWSKFRDDEKLMESLQKITESDFDSRRGYYGEVGNNAIIKNCSIIKDTNIGEFAYIKGANKIKNLTIHSSEKEPSQIGEGVELVNGIMGYGSKIFYGCKAIRFVTGRNTQLKYGARLLNSVLGDNSTVSCCELLNNLIFPFHEQHHNTSFLIASTILGQSNIAAGATIGSNHNSRSPDGEIYAGRGFWPGLCTNFKHNSKFASFVLITKGSYVHELNILYPFSLVSIENSSDPISIMPAYWFMYNMYAIARNNYKFKNRDRRKLIVQNIETDFLAPDSVSEILSAMKRIEYLTGFQLSENKDISEEEAIEKGKIYLKKNDKNDDLILFDKTAMKKIGGNVIKPVRSWNMYKQMCVYFAVKNIFDYFNFENSNIEKFIDKINLILKEKVYEKWWNAGGQLIPDLELTKIKEEIKRGDLHNWLEVHARYDELWKLYPLQKLRYSLFALETVTGKPVANMTPADWKTIINEAVDIFNYIFKTSYESRQKDYTDSFRKMNYENEKEMIAVIGNIKDNDFINQLEIETKKYTKKLKSFL